eukprot:1161001-Pelagomonas_calceolata.AAC.2
MFEATTCCLMLTSVFVRKGYLTSRFCSQRLALHSSLSACKLPNFCFRGARGVLPEEDVKDDNSGISLGVRLLGSSLLSGRLQRQPRLPESKVLHGSGAFAVLKCQPSPSFELRLFLARSVYKPQKYFRSAALVGG